MMQEDLRTVESSQNTSVKSRPTISSKHRKLWDFPLKLIISFIEALGRSSEEFYVYLPLADDPKSRGKSNP